MGLRKMIMAARALRGSSPRRGAGTRLALVHFASTTSPPDGHLSCFPRGQCPEGSELVGVDDDLAIAKPKRPPLSNLLVGHSHEARRKNH